MGWSVLLMGWAPRGFHLLSHLNPPTCSSFSLPSCLILSWGLRLLGNQPLCACPWTSQLIAIPYTDPAHRVGIPFDVSTQILNHLRILEIWARGRKYPLSLEQSKFRLSFIQPKVLFRLWKNMVGKELGWGCQRCTQEKESTCFSSPWVVDISELKRDGERFQQVPC